MRIFRDFEKATRWLDEQKPIRKRAAGVAAAARGPVGARQISGRTLQPCETRPGYLPCR